ncbi:MAG: TrmO family methyltransferase domain-containing protein [Gemmatimonadota bacterium]
MSNEPSEPVTEADPQRIAVQVSLYPLRQPMLAPSIDDALQTFRDHGLHVQPGEMSTMVTGPAGVVFRALEAVFRGAAEKGSVVLTAAVSNACPVPASSDRATAQPRPMRSIGRVENEMAEPASPEAFRGVVSRIVVDPELEEGLTGLEAGDRIMVVFWFHRAGRGELLQHPRGDTTRARRGVFALRSPRRPSPSEVTEVEVVSRAGNVLAVRGLDAIDGTPILDIKPA